MSPIPTPARKPSLQSLQAEQLDWRFKSVPAEAFGSTVADFLDERPALSAFPTPLLTLDQAAIDANVDTMARWCAAHGVELAPHGKTTMAPQLWQQQLDAGAWGITLATVGQVRVARAFGFRRILLANAAVDPHQLRWLSAQMADPEWDFICWADSLDTVAAMDAVLKDVPPARPVPVCVELGAPGARTGARTPQEAIAVAEALHRSPHLLLQGVAGYEGALAHDASAASMDKVRAYLGRMGRLHEALLPGYEVDRPVLTAGGSAYFDVVVEELAGYAGPGQPDAGTRVLLRSGAYITHDDGFYRGISPFARTQDGKSFSPAMHLWARVVSRPEPTLALLDAGKRDLPFDEGLPEPQFVADRLGGQCRPLANARIEAVNDQHAFLRLPEGDVVGGDGHDGRGPGVTVGDVVRLGLSHPCTAFDKWQLIPVFDASTDTEPDPRVVGMVRTFF